MLGYGTPQNPVPPVIQPTGVAPHPVPAVYPGGGFPAPHPMPPVYPGAVAPPMPGPGFGGGPVRQFPPMQPPHPQQVAAWHLQRLAALRALAAYGR